MFGTHVFAVAWYRRQSTSHKDDVTDQARIRQAWPHSVLAPRLNITSRNEFSPVLPMLRYRPGVGAGSLAPTYLTEGMMRRSAAVWLAESHNHGLDRSLSDEVSPARPDYMSG